MGSQSSTLVKTEVGDDVEATLEATATPPHITPSRGGTTKAEKMNTSDGDWYAGSQDDPIDGIPDFDLPDLPAGLPVFSSQVFLDDEPSPTAINTAFDYNSQLTNITSPGSSSKQAKEKHDGSNQGRRSAKKKKKSPKPDAEDRESRLHKRKSKRKQNVEGIDSDPPETALPTPATTATRSRSAFDDANGDGDPQSELVIPTSQPPSRKRKSKFLFESEGKSKRKKGARVSEKATGEPVTDVSMADYSQELVQDSPTDPIVPEPSDMSRSVLPTPKAKRQPQALLDNATQHELTSIIKDHYHFMPSTIGNRAEDPQDSPTVAALRRRSRSRSRSRSLAGPLPIIGFKRDPVTPRRRTRPEEFKIQRDIEVIAQGANSGYESDNDDDPNPDPASQDAALQNYIKAEDEDIHEAQMVEDYRLPLENGPDEEDTTSSSGLSGDDDDDDNDGMGFAGSQHAVGKLRVDDDTTSSSGSSSDDSEERPSQAERDMPRALGPSPDPDEVAIANDETNSSGEESDDEREVGRAKDGLASSLLVASNTDKMDIDAPSGNKNGSSGNGQMATNPVGQPRASIEQPMVQDTDISEIEGLPGSVHDVEVSSRSSSKKTTGKRKQRAKPTYFESWENGGADQEHENIEAFAELPSIEASGTPVVPKKRRVSQRVAAASSSAPSNKKAKTAKLSSSMRKENQGVKSRSTAQATMPNRDRTTGPFDDLELANISAAVEQYRDDHQLTQYEVNALIHEPAGKLRGEKPDDLWAIIAASCPDRVRQKVINITRKKFHNYVARGTWTEEQDEELEKLIEKHERKWAEIGHILNRHPEDIRDRYRNYLICGKNRERSKWTADEEALLVDCVIQAVQAIEKIKRKNPGRIGLNAPYESLIDWQEISKNMGWARSRLQCINKWKNMHIKVGGNDVVMSQQPESTVNWRLEKARKQIRLMDTEDKHKLVDSIRRSAAGKDSRIPWTRLVDKPYRKKWHRPTLVLLWHRLKQSVPGNETKTVRDCSAWLLEQFEQDAVFRDARDSDVDDAEEMDFLDAPKPQQSKRQRKPRASKQKPPVSIATTIESDGSEAENDENGEVDDDNGQPKSLAALSGQSRTTQWLENVDTDNEAGPGVNSDGSNSSDADSDDRQETPPTSKKANKRANKKTGRQGRSRRSATEATESSINASIFKTPKSSKAGAKASKDVPSHTAVLKEKEPEHESEEESEESSVISSDTDMDDIKSIPARLPSNEVY